jgi:flagellar basal-body rod protein FlgB
MSGLEFRVLEKKLDASLLRHRVISNNISNVSTPGYRPLDVGFEAHLRQALERGGVKPRTTDPAHMSRASSLDQVTPTVVRRARGGEGVQIEEEMKSLTEAQIEFMTGIRVLSRLFQNLRMAIRGRTI